jgi:uncharacterized membrane protein
MRTASAPAIANQILGRKHSGHLSRSSLAFMASENLSIALKACAVGEFIVDKLPSTPNRTKPLGVAFRCLSGSITGASIYKASGKNALTGALLGSAAALASTYGCYFLRKTTVKNFHLFDPLVGIIEDAVVVGAGVGLVVAE